MMAKTKGRYTKKELEDRLEKLEGILHQQKEQTEELVMKLAGLNMIASAVLEAHVPPGPIRMKKSAFVGHEYDHLKIRETDKEDEVQVVIIRGQEQVPQQES